MSNKRVSELNEKIVPDDADLFLITDVSAVESKKITAINVKNYVTNNNTLTGSLDGTASYALFAASSSFNIPPISASYALSASFALVAPTSVSASYSTSGSFALFAVSCSYAATSSISFTSSVQSVVSASNAKFSQTASYLLFTNGFNNGTASNAQTASYALNSTNANNLIYTGQPNGTASYALRSGNSDSASTANYSTFLFYDGATPNGTASVAVSASLTQYAQILQNKQMIAGVFSPSVSSSSEIDLLTMSIQRTDRFPQSFTTFTVVGDITLNWTSAFYASMSLFAYNQNTQVTYFYDTVTVGAGAGVVGGTVHSGSSTFPFTLMGMQYLTSGSYWVYVTASAPAISGIRFDFNRTPKFKIETDADIVTVI